MRFAGVFATLALAMAACQSSSSGAFERARNAGRAGDWDTAVHYYERATSEAPDNLEYRMALDRARLEAARAHLVEARRLVATDDVDAAVAEFELALAYDPTNRYARDELEALRVDTHRRLTRRSAERVNPFGQGEPVLDPSSSEPLHIQFPENSSLRTVLQSLAKLAGVNILFDESFRDKRVSVDLEGVSYREALDILMLTNGLFYKTLHSSTVLVEER